MAVIVSLLTTSPILAQQDDYVNDPLNKPQLWNKLKSNPSDLELWSAYTGKKWVLMTDAEQQKILGWRQNLILQEIADKEAIINTMGREVASRSEQLPVIERKQLAGWEAIRLAALKHKFL